MLLGDGDRPVTDLDGDAAGASVDETALSDWSIW